MAFTLQIGDQAPSFELPAWNGQDTHWMPPEACDLV
jgi:hypothetical protein